MRNRQLIGGGTVLQKQFAAERIAALVEERRMHEVDVAAQDDVASAKHDELLQRLHRTEDTLQTTTKDYILGKPLTTPRTCAPEHPCCCPCLLLERTRATIARPRLDIAESFSLKCQPAISVKDRTKEAAGQGVCISYFRYAHPAWA